VHAAVADEAEEVQGGVLPYGAVDRVAQDLVPRELPGLDRVADLVQVLVDDAAGAHARVPDLGVADLPRGQADGDAAGVEAVRRVLASERLHVDRAAVGDRVRLAPGRMAPAVQDEEDRRARRRSHQGTPE